MLARNPDDRYQMVSEIIVDLERSELTAPIPSFISMDSALQDPVVRQRLTAPIQATLPDIQLNLQKQAKDKGIWYLRYRDQRGNLCKSKATTGELLDRLRAWALAAQHGSGPVGAGEVHGNRQMAGVPASGGAVAVGQESGTEKLLPRFRHEPGGTAGGGSLPLSWGSQLS